MKSRESLVERAPMGKQKTNNILRTIGFSLLAITIFILLNSLLQTDNFNKNWYQFKSLSKNSINIFFAGNSRSYTSINPNLIEDSTGLDGYVLGVGGESLAITYYEIKEMFKTQSPSLVFLEVYPIYRSETDQQYSLHINDFFGTLPFFKIDRNMLWHFFITNQLTDLIPLASTHSKVWKEPNTFFYYYDQYYQGNIHIDQPWVVKDFVENRGYINGYRQISQSSLNQHATSNPITQTSLSPKTLNLLKDIKNLCEKNNAILILWSIPQHTHYVDVNGIDLNYQEIAQLNQIPFYDLHQESFELIHFADINHLAPFGSQKVSLLISQYLLNNRYTSLDNGYIQQFQKITPQTYQYQQNQENQFILTFTMESAFDQDQIIGFAEVAGQQIPGEIINSNQIQFTLAQKPQTDYIKISFENKTIKRQIEQFVYINYSEK